jgi:hypothetical protein
MRRFIDRVKQTTTTTGTGALSLGAAETGYITIASVVADLVPVYYTVEGGAEWEVGLGWTESGIGFVRNTVFASSNAGALVNFSSGTKMFFLTAPAYALNRFDTHGKVLARTRGLALA